MCVLLPPRRYYVTGMSSPARRHTVSMLGVMCEKWGVAVRSIDKGQHETPTHVIADRITTTTNFLVGMCGACVGFSGCGVCVCVRECVCVYVLGWVCGCVGVRVYLDVRACAFVCAYVCVYW